jgi:hypothetical protein
MRELVFSRILYYRNLSGRGFTGIADQNNALPDGVIRFFWVLLERQPGKLLRTYV